jgi:hypothetical protein
MASSFQIESGVPVPAAKPGTRQFPFAEMQVGDSFFVSGGNKAEIRASQAAYQYAKVHGVKFTTGAVEGGRRIWRVA